MTSDVDTMGQKIGFVLQKNINDFDYIMTLAERYNYKVWSKNKKLFVIKYSEQGTEEVILEMGKTLVELRGGSLKLSV